MIRSNLGKINSIKIKGLLLAGGLKTTLALRINGSSLAPRFSIVIAFASIFPSDLGIPSNLKTNWSAQSLIISDISGLWSAYLPVWFYRWWTLVLSTSEHPSNPNPSSKWGIFESLWSVKWRPNYTRNWMGNIQIERCDFEQFTNVSTYTLRLTKWSKSFTKTNLMMTASVIHKLGRDPSK